MTDPDALAAAVTAFWTALPEQRRPVRSELLEPVVRAAWQRARDAHPELSVTAVELMRFSGERITSGDPGRELERRHIADLYLACGCAAGKPAAIAAFEQLTLPAVDRGLAGRQFSNDARAELLQMLREQMLIATSKPPGIAAYDGRAPLAVWLRVCAARMGSRLAQRERRIGGIADDDQLDQLVPGVPSPELAYLRRHYGAQFRAAFRVAVAKLAPRERNLLRHSVIDSLGIDQIAAIYHVHRATAARQLKRARETLIAGTREHMRVALGVSETELDSILRVMMTMTDVTLRAVLGRNGPSET